jgi:hypothetical protein
MSTARAKGLRWRRSGGALRTRVFSASRIGSMYVMGLKDLGLIVRSSGGVLGRGGGDSIDGKCGGIMYTWGVTETH